MYFNTDDNMGYELPVISITTASSTNPVVRVNITGFPALNGSINGQGVIYKRNSSKHIAPYVSNASNSLQQVIQEAMVRDIESSLNTATEVSSYVGTNGTAPAFTPASGEPRIAKPISGNELYLYNGSAWSLVSGGGSADTSYYRIVTRDDVNRVFVKGIEKGLKITNQADTSQIMGFDYPAMDLPSTYSNNGDFIAVYDSLQNKHVKIKVDTLLNGKANRVSPVFTNVPFKNGITAGSTDSLLTIDPSTGVVGSIKLSDVAGAASNGLTKTGSNTVLGGALTSATTVTTDATNTFSIAGLQSSLSTGDSVVMVNNITGQLKKKPLSDITPSVTSTRIPFGSNSNTITSSSNLTFDSTQKVLKFQNVPFTSATDGTITIEGANTVSSGVQTHLLARPRPAQAHDAATPARIPSFTSNWGGGTFPNQYVTDYVHSFGYNFKPDNTVQFDSINAFSINYETAYSQGGTGIDSVRASEFHFIVQRPSKQNFGRNYSSRIMSWYLPERAHQDLAVTWQSNKWIFADAENNDKLSILTPNGVGAQTTFRFNNNAKIVFNNTNPSMIESADIGNVLGYNGNGFTLGNYLKTGVLGGGTYLYPLNPFGISINNTSNRGAGLKMYIANTADSANIMIWDNKASNDKIMKANWNNFQMTSTAAVANNTVTPVSISLVSPASSFIIDSLGSVGMGATPLSYAKLNLDLAAGGIYGNLKDYGVRLANLNKADGIGVIMTGTVTGAARALETYMSCTSTFGNLIQNTNASNANAHARSEIWSTAGGGEAQLQFKTGTGIAGSNQWLTRAVKSQMYLQFENENTGNVPVRLHSTGNVSINSTANSNKLTIDASSDGNPLKLIGIQAGSTSDSIVTSASGVLKRLSITEVVNGNTIKLSNQSVTIPAITGMTTGSVDVTVTGAVVGNTVTVNPRTDISVAGDDVIIGHCYVSAPNTVKIVFFHTAVTTGSSVARNFDIKVDKN